MIAPIVVAIMVADQAVALVMRFRLPMLPAIAVGAVAPFVALVVGIDPTVITPGSPHFFDLHFVSHQISCRAVRLGQRRHPLAFARGGRGRHRCAGRSGGRGHQVDLGEPNPARAQPAGHVGPLTGCIAPSLGVFVYSTLVSADHGRAPAALAYFAGVAAFVALSDRVGLDVRSWRASWRVPAGGVISCLAVLAVVVVAGAGLSSMHLSVFHVTPPANGPSGSHGDQTESLYLSPDRYGPG